MSADFSMDWSRFEWKPTVEDPRCYPREPAGGEHLRVSVIASLQLSDSLRNAWYTLCHTTPIIALRTEWDENGNPFMTYCADPDANKVRPWAPRTCCRANGVQDGERTALQAVLKGSARQKW